jgi:hypothetical protein
MQTAFAPFLFFGRRALADAPAKRGRDLRIDVARGLALLIIFINHMPGNIVASVTPHAYGFSDSAEIFVLLSGVSAALAFGGTIDSRGFTVGALKVAARVRTLYLVHLAVLMAVVGLVAVAVDATDNPLLIETVNIQPLVADPLRTLKSALLLTYQPNFLDILPLYVVLLAGFPLLHYAVAASPAAALTLSGGLWWAAGAFDLNLSNGNGGWYFNPLAWQFLFAIGVVLGQAIRGGVALPAGRFRSLLDAGALAMVAFAVVVMQAPIDLGGWLGAPAGAWPGTWVADLALGTDKTNLAAVRLLHVLALTWLTVRLVAADAAWLRRPAVRLLARTGSHSLEVFATGLVLSIAGQVIMAQTAFDPIAQLLVVAAGVTVLVCLGNFLTWSSSLTTSAAPRTAPAEPSPSASARPSSSSV